MAYGDGANSNAGRYDLGDAGRHGGSRALRGEGVPPQAAHTESSRKLPPKITKKLTAPTLFFFGLQVHGRRATMVRITTHGRAVGCDGGGRAVFVPKQKQKTTRFHTHNCISFHWERRRTCGRGLDGQLWQRRGRRWPPLCSSSSSLGAWGSFVA